QVAVHLVEVATERGGGEEGVVALVERVELRDAEPSADLAHRLRGRRRDLEEPAPAARAVARVEGGLGRAHAHQHLGVYAEGGAPGSRPRPDRRASRAPRSRPPAPSHRAPPPRSRDASRRPTRVAAHAAAASPSPPPSRRAPSPSSTALTLVARRRYTGRRMRRVARFFFMQIGSFVPVFVYLYLCEAAFSADAVRHALLVALVVDSAYS